MRLAEPRPLTRPKDISHNALRAIYDIKNINVAASKYDHSSPATLV